MLKAKDALYTFTSTEESRTTTVTETNTDPKTGKVTVTETEVTEIWKIYTIVYNGEAYFEDKIFALSDEQKGLAENYAQNLSVFLGDGMMQGLLPAESAGLVSLGDIRFSDGATQVVYYNQLDKRYAHKPYGTDDIGTYGCGPTCMAMVVSSLTNETVDPVEMARWAYENGYWCSRSGSYHSLIPGAAKAWGLPVQGCGKTEGQRIVDAFSQGKLVVAIMLKGHFTSSGHFIVLRGVENGKILALVALSGELPASQLSRLAGGTSYKENVVKSLKRQRLLLSYYKNGLRGYRLTAAAKKLLLEHNPERFSFYLSGACATNHIRSEPEQRLRLHRVSQTLITMRNANVSIFRDEKLGVFRPGETATGSICTPAFYSSREIKEMGTTFVKIRGARSVGVLLTPQHIHVVYNMGNALMKWSYKAEMRTKALMQTVLCRERMPHQYHPDAVRGLLLGDSMELAYELLTDQGGKNYFVLDGSYERFCFLTNDHHGEVLLRLLCDEELDNGLRELLLLDLEPRQLSETVENDAMTPDGAPVLFAYDCDLPRIRRFDTALRLQDRYGILICFDHQAEVLRRYCGDRVVVQAIDFAAFERRFFP